MSVVLGSRTTNIYAQSNPNIFILADGAGSIVKVNLKAINQNGQITKVDLNIGIQNIVQAKNTITAFADDTTTSILNAKIRTESNIVNLIELPKTGPNVFSLGGVNQEFIFWI